MLGLTAGSEIIALDVVLFIFSRIIFRNAMTQQQKSQQQQQRSGRLVQAASSASGEKQIRASRTTSTARAGNTQYSNAIATLRRTVHVMSGLLVLASIDLWLLNCVKWGYFPRTIVSTTLPGKGG